MMMDAPSRPHDWGRDFSTLTYCLSCNGAIGDYPECAKGAAPGGVPFWPRMYYTERIGLGDPEQFIGRLNRFECRFLWHWAWSGEGLGSYCSLKDRRRGTEIGPFDCGPLLATARSYGTLAVVGVLDRLPSTRPSAPSWAGELRRWGRPV